MKIGRLKPLAKLLLPIVVVVALQMSSWWGQFYHETVYPWVAQVLSAISSLLPFALGDLFIALALFGCVARPVWVLLVRKESWKKAWLPIVCFLLGVYVWFYVAWGFNYGEPDFFHRSGTACYEADSTAFRTFAYRYADSLNASWTPIRDDVREAVPDLVHRAYEEAASRGMGISNPFVAPNPKTMLFSALSSKVGVTGSMAPFFGEFTLNGDLQAHEYPFTFAHEYSHQLGVANEGEANFYAYEICTSSPDMRVRFSGRYAIFFHVLRSVESVLGSDEAARFLQTIRPEIRTLAASDRQYWRERYSGTLGEAQNWIYDLYLRGNRVEGGRRSYSAVVGLILCWEHRETPVKE